MANFNKQTEFYNDNNVRKGYHFVLLKCIIYLKMHQYFLKRNKLIDNTEKM